MQFERLVAGLLADSWDVARRLDFHLRSSDDLLVKCPHMLAKAFDITPNSIGKRVLSEPPLNLSNSKQTLEIGLGLRLFPSGPRAAELAPRHLACLQSVQSCFLLANRSKALHHKGGLREQNLYSLRSTISKSLDRDGQTPIALDGQGRNMCIKASGLSSKVQPRCRSRQCTPSGLCIPCPRWAKLPAVPPRPEGHTRRMLAGVWHRHPVDLALASSPEEAMGDLVELSTRLCV